MIFIPRTLTGELDQQHARRFVSAGLYIEASSAYESAAQRLPWQTGLWQQAGQAALASGDVKAALIFFQNAVDKNSLSPDGWIAFGDAYQELSDISMAVRAWEHALPSIGAYQRLAHAYRASGDFSACIENLRALLNLSPDDAEAHYQLGLLLTSTLTKDALPELMRSAQLDPKLDKSVQVLRTSLNIAFQVDDRAYQFVEAGRALGAIGEWDLASEGFHQAIGIREGYAEAWAWLGEAKQHLGLNGSAELQKAITLNPNSAMIQVISGLYWQRQGQSLKALTVFSKAVEIEPENAGWQISLAGAYVQAGDFVSALVHYRRAVELAPLDASAWRALASFSVNNNVDVVEIGFPVAQKLLALAPEDWQSHDIAGQATFEKGNLRDAERQFLKAIELASEQAAPHLHLGLVYLQTGDQASARDYLVTARDLDPSGHYGWLARRLLDEYFP